jgi:DNA integrity scanning protein DisA with diadenylate cyclase activity
MSKKSAVVEKSVVEMSVVENVVENVEKPRERIAKQYGISAGKLPEENQKPLGLHALIIIEAIKDLLNEGKTSASRNEIMEKAVELGLYERKPSRQGTVPIFSWWRKPLRELGWINY